MKFLIEVVRHSRVLLPILVLLPFDPCTIGAMLLCLAEACAVSECAVSVLAENTKAVAAAIFTNVLTAIVNERTVFSETVGGTNTCWAIVAMTEIR